MTGLADTVKILTKHPILLLEVTSLRLGRNAALANPGPAAPLRRSLFVPHRGTVLQLQSKQGTEEDLYISTGCTSGSEASAPVRLGAERRRADKRRSRVKRKFARRQVSHEHRSWP